MASNSEIVDCLFISTSTADHHVSAIPGETRRHHPIGGMDKARVTLTVV